VESSEMGYSLLAIGYWLFAIPHPMRINEMVSKDAERPYLTANSQ
jgi:hypothetical protein